MSGLSNGIYLSVIIPGLNQGAQLSQTFTDIASQIGEFDFETEVIYVDGHSTDNTLEIVSQYEGSLINFRLLHDSHDGAMGNFRGKGAAVKAGMLNASGRFRMYLDADSSTPFSEIKKFIPFLEDGYQLVMGSRYVSEPAETGGAIQACSKALTAVAELVFTGKTGSNRSRKKQSWIRQFMSRGGNLAFAVLLGIKVADSRCGFKAYSAEAAEMIFPYIRIPGFGFEEETLIMASNNDLRMIEVPVEWYDNDDSSSVVPLRDSLKSFEEILKVEWFRMNGKYRKTKKD